MMRKLLVGSAQYILGPFGPDTNLRRHGLRLCERGGKNAKKRVAVGVARKLAVLLHRLWVVTGEVYEPLRRPRRRQHSEPWEVKRDWPRPLASKHHHAPFPGYPLRSPTRADQRFPTVPSVTVKAAARANMLPVKHDLFIL